MNKIDWTQDAMGGYLTSATLSREIRLVPHRIFYREYVEQQNPPDWVKKQFEDNPLCGWAVARKEGDEWVSTRKRLKLRRE